jgi:hypothetical protein
MAYTPKSKPKKGAHLYKHGLVGHPLYGRWRRMIQRCTDPNAKDYKSYGARGITVCNEWMSFEVFLAQMGEPKAKQELDRIDNSKGYCAENCRWVDRSTNMKNTRNSVIIEYNGESKNLGDWAKIVGVARDTLKYRLKNWPIEKAMSKCKFKTNGEPA